MTASAFESATRVTPIADGRYGADVPDGWQQGRGAFGGLVLALLARAAEATVADPTRRIRTIAGDLCGPVMPGAAEIAVRILRRGSNQSNVAAELVQGGGVAATATLVLSAPRAVDVPARVPAAPAAPDAGTIDPLPVGPPLGPVFASHYAYRNVGPLPFAGGTEAHTLGYIREREAIARVDAAALIARLDAYWPALFSVASELRPTATIQFTAELLVDPSTLDPERPLLHRGRVEALRDGLFLELRELWSGGELVAMNQQTMAILR